MKVHKKATKENHLCWGCANCFGGCSWSREGIPPKSAKYEIVDYGLRNGGREKATKNYHITACGEFIPDSEMKIDPKSVSDDGVINLLTAFGRRLNLDYYNACLYLKADEHGIGVKDRKLYESKLIVEEAQRWLSEPRRAKIEKMVEENFAKGIIKPQKGNVGEGFFDE